MRLPRETHRWTLFATIAIALSSAFVAQVQLAAAEPSRRTRHSLVGSFSTSDSYTERNNLSISISVVSEDGGYRLDFQGGGRAIHGHAPEGAGRGEIKDGVFRFAFEDSFFNRGSGTFRRVGKHYVLHIDISHIAEPRIMSAYGDTPLYRDSSGQG